MKKINFLVVVAVLFCFANTSYAYESYKIESGSNHFADLQIYTEGESFVYNPLDPSEVTTPIATFTSEQKNSIIQATKMWADTIKMNPLKDNNYATYATYIYDDSAHPNAAAATIPVQVNEDTLMSNVNAVLFKEEFYPLPVITDGQILIGATIMSGSDNYIKPTPLHHGANGDLTSFMYHELAHALGVNSATEQYNSARDYPKTFSDVLMTWDKHLRVYNTAINKEVSSAPDKEIGTQIGNTAEFDLTKYAPYFVGNKTIKVLAGDRDGSKTISEYQTIIKNAGGLVNYSINYDEGHDLEKVNRICYGLPILPGTKITVNGLPDLSHIELRNSLMSHQFYRNWKTFMEAELASMIDIGYNIDLKNFFGKSYYLNNLTDYNKTGYYKSNGDGTYDTTKPNDADYGTGVHIYGNKNTITQKSDILSVGAGSIGARIEGIENIYNLADGYEINMTGSDSIGIAATWGTGHEININANSSVKSTGTDGIAISLNFGDNILGIGYETQGSYIYNAFSVDKDPSLKELNGELVKGLNINGTVEGTKASIYISHNAYVENININNGSTIKGDIISEWNSKQTYDNIKVQTGGEIKYTNLNFNNYIKDFENNITGSSVNNTIKMNVTGNLGLKNSVVDVHSLNNDGTIDIKGISGLFTSDSTNSVTGTGTINVQNTSTLALGSSVQNIQNTMNFNGGSLNLINNVANDINFNKMNINSDMDLGVDIDLATLKADNLVFQNVSDLTVNDDITIYTNLNNTNTILTGNNIKIPFVNNQLKNTNFLEHIYESSSNVTNINTPIYKYQINYVENENMGNFVLTHGSSNNYSSYNPAIVASPVAAQAGSYITQINSYDQAFANMDQAMLMTRAQRTAWKARNKYAAAEGAGGGVVSYDPNQFPAESKGVWFRPFASFENVPLNNGPKVDNISYGGLIGGDSDLIELKHGWDMVWGAYAGYNGSHQNYQGNSVYQNGGMLGLNAVWYKGDFFTGLTANVGASVADASTMYGKEYMTMLSTGIASKTGYNWELFNSKFIIQPSLLMSYSFINTFDYRNAAGVDMHSDPLNAIQIVPGLKFIGNLPHGWQPYIGVQMIWNLLDKSKVWANDVSLPEMSVDPFVQYGVGVQKSWGEKFTGFGQVMLRNGGRNGISLQAGFRWALGNDAIKNTLKAGVKHNSERTVSLTAK